MKVNNPYNKAQYEIKRKTWDEYLLTRRSQPEEFYTEEMKQYCFQKQKNE